MPQRSEDLEPLVLLEDEPVRNDTLGIDPFARVVAGAAVGTQGPFTIGVFANWGEGKTSLLRLSRDLVDGFDNNAVTVWFNAWQYEKEEHPMVPLVATIVRAVDQKLAVLDEAENAVKAGLSKVSRALRAIAYGFSGKANVKVPGFGEIEAGFVAKEMIDRYEKLSSDRDPLLDRTLYYNAFETLESVTAEGIKVVVFIDDLDRCLPPQALKLLESIKLVLAQKGFIFVLAVDRRVLESYLTSRYEEEFGMKGYTAGGTQYLDKIVQLPLALPSHETRFTEYIEQLLAGRVFSAPSNQQVKDAVIALSYILAIGSNYNPRNLVRFLNNLIVDRQIWRSVEPKAKLDATRLGLCIVARILRQHLGDVLYRWLSKNDVACSRLADDEPKSSAEGPPTPAQSGSLDERSQSELDRRLDESPFLIQLLKTESGLAWLRNSEDRKTIDNFVVQPDSANRVSADRVLAGLEQYIIAALHAYQRDVRELLDAMKRSPAGNSVLFSRQFSERIARYDERHQEQLKSLRDRFGEHPLIDEFNRLIRELIFQLQRAEVCLQAPLRANAESAISQAADMVTLAYHELARWLERLAHEFRRGEE
jgi:hypothetical protein